CRTSSILITSGERIHECVLLSLVRSSTQLVGTDRKLRTGCQEEGPARSRKDGKIQGGLHSQSDRHRDPEEGQEKSAQQGSGARVPSNHKAETQQAFRARCNDGQSRNQALRQKPIELSRVHHESRESSQDTLGRPKAPHNPNRSARAERKDR